MIFAISPKHTTEDFKNGWNLDDKIDVFIARVEGWQLGVANIMVEKKIPHRKFAILMIIISYFEMIAKYRDGYVEELKGRRKGEGKSAYFFKEGLKDVFPDMSLPEDELVTAAIYENVRNGLYHAGGTRSNVLLSDDTPNTIGYNMIIRAIAINPDLLVRELQSHFDRFSRKLRDPANATLRANFEARFDVDNE
jgi:hypothetical protein